LPINVNGIQLTARQGRIVFGLFACLSPIGIVPLIATVYVAFARNRRVTLTSKSIILPRPTRMGLSCEETEIPFESIVAADLVHFMGRAKVLRIRHRGGVAGIPSNMFSRLEHFKQLCELLQQALLLARSQRDFQRILGSYTLK
jgi:hypothetical protein